MHPAPSSAANSEPWRPSEVESIVHRKLIYKWSLSRRKSGGLINESSESERDVQSGKEVGTEK